MSRKLPNTPRSRVRSALRQVFLRSRERAACLKKAENKCFTCKRKASRAKGREVFVQVHHIAPIDIWQEVLDLVYAKILCSPDQMICLCKECHSDIHKKGKSK